MIHSQLTGTEAAGHASAPSPSRKAAPRIGCAVVAYSLTGDRHVVLWKDELASSRLAVRWMRERAARLAALLDPEPGSGPIPAGVLVPVTPSAADPGAALRAWLADEGTHEWQVNRITAGHLVALSAGDGETLYAISAQPESVTGRTGRQNPHHSRDRIGCASSLGSAARSPQETEVRA